MDEHWALALNDLPLVFDNAAGHGLAEVLAEQRRREEEESCLKEFLATSSLGDEYESEAEMSLDESDLDCTWLNGDRANGCTAHTHGHGHCRKSPPTRTPSASRNLRRLNTVPKCPVRRKSGDDQMLMLQNLYGRFGDDASSTGSKSDCTRTPPTSRENLASLSRLGY